MRNGAVWMLAVLGVLAARPAAANDGAFYGEGATVFPVKDDAIAMETEDLVIRQAGAAIGPYVETWKVEVTYTFRNTTDRPVTVQMGFPETCVNTPENQDDDGNRKGPCEPTIRNFTVTIDGVRGESVVKRPDAVAKPALPELYYDRVHTFSVPFAPGQTRTVRHTYDHATSIIAGYISDLTYILRTGSLWKGSIARLDITVGVWDEFESFERGESVPAPTAIEKGGDGYRNYRWHFEKVEPSFDLALLFTKPDGLARQEAIAAVCDKTDEELRRLSKDALGILRNTIYAAYGYSFERPQYREHFAGVPWYRPRIDYDPAWISKHDLACVKRLKALEAAAR